MKIFTSLAITKFDTNNESINEIIVIRGPNKEKFRNSKIIYVDDLNFEEHDILGSLMEAKNFINGDVIITYSDIIFDEQILATNNLIHDEMLENIYSKTSTEK